MNYGSYERIRVERKGRILTLALNRPDHLNAIDDPMHEELSRIFHDVQIDDEADVIVLTGVGRAFSAGGVVAWPHLVGHARAKEYLLTGDLLTAAEAAIRETRRRADET